MITSNARRIMAMERLLSEVKGEDKIQALKKIEKLASEINAEACRMRNEVLISN